MNFEINDEFGYEKDITYLDDVLNKTLELENVKDAIFSIIFVDEPTIQKINKDYRGLDKVTDVISFAFQDNEKVVLPVRLLGEIYICIPKMIEQAKEYGHSEKRELSFLAVHGLLHLLGYDHTLSAEDEKVMFQKQDDILNSLQITK